MRKNILIIAGPSAVGKTTVAHRMLELDSRFEFVRSVTTRARRMDAFDNEYIYITDDEFRHLIANGGVLEHTEYAGNLYGTPRSEIDRITSEGKIPLLILDINGVTSIYRNKGDIFPCGVYVYDNIDVMEERLRQRYADDWESEDTRRRFNSRRVQNIADYKGIQDSSAVFYSFVKNCASVDNCAKNISDIFEEFCSDVARADDNISAVAASLAESVANK